MPTVAQAFEFYRVAMQKGKGDMHTGHCFIAEEETEKRLKNKERTRFSKDLGTHTAYEDWEKEWRKWIDACGGHKPIAQDLMLRALQQYNEQMIAKLAADEQSEAKESLGDA